MKKRQITQQFKTLGSLDLRKDFASNLNKIKDDLSRQIEQKSLKETLEINEKLKNEKVDVLYRDLFNKEKFIHITSH